MNCNDCGGFLPRGCTCSPFGGRKTQADDEAYLQFQRDRIAEAQKHDAEQAKPKLSAGVTAVAPAIPGVRGPRPFAPDPSAPFGRNGDGSPITMDGGA